MTCDTVELQKLHQKLHSIQDAFLTMKSKKKEEIIVDAFDNLKKLFSADKLLLEIFDMMSVMTKGFVDRLVHRKKKLKTEIKEGIDKHKAEMEALESKLFQTKVETETLKHDKKYIED